MKRGERPPSKRGELSSSSSQRSVSPIGLGAILKPTKWFQRSNSSKSNLSTTVETRTSLTKISNPTNPRPSVLSLSMNRSTSQLAVSIPQSSSGSTHSGSGIGDLRAASGKKWSKSVDDLSKFSPDSPISPSSLFSARIGEYRSGALQSPSSTLLPSTQTPARPPLSAGPGTVAFPTKASAVDEEANNVGRSSCAHTSSSHKSITSLKAAQAANARAAHQMVTSLNPAGAPSRPSYERSLGSTEKSTAGAGGTNPGYNVRTFGFPFGMTHKPSTSPPQIVLFSALESGSNATLATTKASKRSSQMVIHQGFLMRLDHPTQPEKGKPFKGVLTGNKLQLYKPPSDKSAELKELFPEGLVAQGIEEEEEEEAESASPGGAVTNRTKRKYWGRAQHPELQIVGEDKELQGTLDALVHEIVFGTTFDSQLEKETFAQVVLLCLPNVLPQHSDFDEALIRYLGSAFRTLGQDDRCGDSTEERKTKEKEWLEWLVGTYVLLHGGLAGDGWDDWLESVDLQLDSCVVRAREASGALVASPYVGVFSPRPNEAGAFESIPTHSPRLAPSISTHALVLPPGTVVPVNAITSDTISEFFSRPSKLGNTLDRDRLSRDVFLKVPSATIAKALRVLNQVFLVQAVQGWGRAPITSVYHLPDTFVCHGARIPPAYSAARMSPSLANSAGHDSSLVTRYGGARTPRVGYSWFNWSCGWPWRGNHSGGRESFENPYKAAVLCKWIRLGELARVNGDECTWRAVQAAVCSRAIARLERVFRRMSDEEREIVNYKCTPWESNVRERIAQEMVRARLKGGELWHVKPFENAWSMVQAMGVTWNKCTGGVLPLGDSDVEDVIGLVRYFRRHAEDEELKVSATSHTEGTGPVEMTQEHIQEVVTRTRAFQSGGQGQSKGKEVRLLGEDLGETTLTVFSGELVLKLVKEEKGTGERALSRSTTMLRNVSRPASLVEEDGLEGLSASLSGILSPNSSGVLSPGSAALRLERKPSRNPSIELRHLPTSSVTKCNSITPIVPSLNFSTRKSGCHRGLGEPPLRALVSSGSLEKLVDVLISGLEEVGMQTSPADDNGETSLREGRTRGVRVDHGEYCRIFWGMFRSFVTPMVLFEMIQKRYRNAANKKSFTSSSLARFSSHSNPDGNPEDDQYRNEIIQTLTNWIVEGAGGQDLLDDTDFYGAMHRVTRRPNMETPSVPSAGHSSTGFGSTVPTLDDIDPETLADNLDAIAAAALKPVTLTDLIVALDLFETQSVDKLGWYALQDVDTSPLISEMGPEKFVRNLPSSIRSVFRAHDIVRRWALASIVAPRLGIQVRQERIELLLRTIEVCRLRTADSPSSQDILQPSIRTFTETALGAALCSPESRLFTRAWQEILVQPYVKRTESPAITKATNAIQYAPCRRGSNDKHAARGFGVLLRAAGNQGGSIQGEYAIISAPRASPQGGKAFPSPRRRAEREEQTRQVCEGATSKGDQERKDDFGRRDDNINKAMLPKGGHGQRKKNRSMSGFFTMLRPISSAWSGDKFQDKIMKPRTLQELDFEPTGKPSVVVNVASAQVQDAVNTHRSFVMRLRTEDGDKLDLRTTAVDVSGGEIGCTEAGVPSFNTTTKHPNPVYGVPLEELLEREYGFPPPADAVPHIVKICIQEVESRGLTEPGIYRLVPSTTELAQLRDMFDSGAAFEGKLDPHTDIMAYTSALKAWFRSLPECAFTDALYNDFIAAARELDGNAKAARLQELVLSLPSANFHLLRVMFEHLDHVVECERDNHMSAENVATCLAQSMIFPPGGTGGSIFPINLGEHHQLVKCLIIQSNQVFQQLGEEVEPEASLEEVHRYEDIIEEQAIDSDSEEGLEEIPITRASTTRLDMFEDDIFSPGTTQRANEAWGRKRAGS
ncbi:breakpoint cluster region [Rhizoctonia solani]|uniref:Breakpoint cluster region n=1 Tax=Rhizoctonia solani TaxID=456999 RepID=A0A8H8T1N0_9AGAM|nr:breakpoint cluster region [Rhizoctonia solani]QRW25524.1 breakpoint cluster region [Rhizoctonia solani]